MKHELANLLFSKITFDNPMIMKTGFHLCYLAVCSSMLFANLELAHAQDQPLPPLKGTPLYDAFTTIKKAVVGPITGISKDSPEYKPDLRTKSEIYSVPELTGPIAVVLDAVDKLGLDHLSKNYRFEAIYAIVGAVASGRSEFVPTLKRLARSSDVEVRKAVTDQEANRMSPAPSLEVMKESLLGALEHLPQEITDTFECRTRVEEFTGGVEMYCEFSTLQQRKEIRPLVEKFLKSGPRAFEEFYRPKLEEILKAESPRMKYAAATMEESASKPAFPPFLVWSLVILVTIGFLWMGIKIRQRA